MRLGFDAISNQEYLGVQPPFEHSPLSCQKAAQVLACNEHCLLDTIEDATAAAKLFSSGGYEPGDDYVVEVFESSSD